MKIPLLMIPVALAALALGYLWPYHPPSASEAAHVDWQNVTAGERTSISADPGLLVRFWPMSQAEPETDANANANANTAHWRLVAVIRQGSHRQAMVQSPAGELFTLAAGDALDAERTVSAVLSSELHWQSEQQQGSLPLFPRPAVTSNPDITSTADNTSITDTTHE